MHIKLPNILIRQRIIRREQLFTVTLTTNSIQNNEKEESFMSTMVIVILVI